jgi:hypothetical protein
MRTLPTPDPIACFLEEEEYPLVMLRLSPQERALRLRFFLVGRCAGLHDALSWHITFSSTPDELWEVVDLWDDGRLARAIADADRRRTAGLPIEYPFTG